MASKLGYLLVAFYGRYKAKYFLKTHVLFDYRQMVNYIYGSWSYILHALLVVVFVQIDIVMLKNMEVSFDEIGLYSAAVKIYMAVVILSDVLFKQYYPRVAKLVINKNDSKLKILMLKVQSMNISTALYLSIITALLAKEIVGFAFGDTFELAGNMLVLLSIIIVFRFSMYTYTAILSASHMNHAKLITSITCVVVNVVACVSVNVSCSP